MDLDPILDSLADKIALRLRPQGPKAQLLTVPQAAERLARSPGALRKLIQQGIVPAVRLDDRVFVDERDLERVIGRGKK